MNGKMTGRGIRSLYGNEMAELIREARANRAWISELATQVELMSSMRPVNGLEHMANPLGGIVSALQMTTPLDDPFSELRRIMSNNAFSAFQATKRGQGA